MPTTGIITGALLAGSIAALSAQAGVPASPLDPAAYAALEKRCGTPRAASSESVGALQRARWVPYLHLDQAVARNGIEVIGGMTAASPGCEPENFNLFVFVDAHSRGR